MPEPTEIDATDIFRTKIRTTPTGFCWEFHGGLHDGSTTGGGCRTKKRKAANADGPHSTVVIRLYFDLTWAAWLARDLWTLVGLRKSENDAIAKALSEDSSDDA